MNNSVKEILKVVPIKVVDQPYWHGYVLEKVENKVVRREEDRLIIRTKMVFGPPKKPANPVKHSPTDETSAG